MLNHLPQSLLTNIHRENEIKILTVTISLLLSQQNIYRNNIQPANIVLLFQSSTNETLLSNTPYTDQCKNSLI